MVIYYNFKIKYIYLFNKIMFNYHKFRQQVKSIKDAEEELSFRTRMDQKKKGEYFVNFYFCRQTKTI